MKEPKSLPPLTPLDSTGQRMRVRMPSRVAAGRAALTPRPSAALGSTRPDVPPGYHTLSELRGRFPEDVASACIRIVLRTAPAERVNTRTGLSAGATRPDENTLLDPVTWASVLRGASELNARFAEIDGLEDEGGKVALAIAQARKTVKDDIKRIRQIEQHDMIEAYKRRDAAEEGALTAERKRLAAEVDELTPDLTRWAERADEIVERIKELGGRIR